MMHGAGEASEQEQGRHDAKSSMDATSSTDYLFAIGFSKRLLLDALCQGNLVVIAPVQVTSVVRARHTEERARSKERAKWRARENGESTSATESPDGTC